MDALTDLGSTLFSVYVAVSVSILCYSYQKIVMEPILNRMLRNCLESADDAVNDDESASCCIVLDDTTNTRKSILMMSPLPLPTPTQEEKNQALRDYKVTIEYKHLKSHAPGGVYLIPSMDSLRTFYGVIFVRRGAYTNGIFKFTLTLPPKYNDINQHPVIKFTSDVFNPFVDPETGLLDLKTTYPRWDNSRHYLVTVLTFLKKIFYAKTWEDATANPEAKQLAETDPAAFRAKVDQCVRDSQKHVYDQNVENSTIKFTEEALAHRVLRDLMKANIKDPAQISKNTILAMIDKASTV